MGGGYVPLAGRRLAVEIVFAAVVAVALVALAFDVLELRLMNRVIAGRSRTPSSATTTRARPRSESSAGSRT